MSFLIFGCTSVQRPSSIPTPPTPQNTWDRYKPTTLTELKTTLFHFPEKHVGMTINAEATSKPVRVKAVYLADLRQMSPFRREFIRKWWGATFKISDDFTQLFEQELLVEAEGEQYWIPVQSQLIPDFQNELKSGDKVELYVMAIGSIDHEDKHEWIFIINEFQKLLTASAVNSRLKAKGFS
jgi:hypothetical protein